MVDCDRVLAAYRGSPRVSTIARKTHLDRTLMLEVFTTLLTGHYMVSHCPTMDKIWEVKVILNASVPLEGSTCNMTWWVVVVHNISLEKVLM
ncbi:hypothetical protein J1N35_041201 [Gossypium stocksii]|uniref:Uncharacterized protein n=1 Tax=Gossypium stocksii TaxID=47602 RepID=A0A9D3UFN8_9ROSI|nr:hypothetical protein J1N35_041201 [Gossypium stocksii]